MYALDLLTRVWGSGDFRNYAEGIEHIFVDEWDAPVVRRVRGGCRAGNRSDKNVFVVGGLVPEFRILGVVGKLALSNIFIDQLPHVRSIARRREIDLKSDLIGSEDISLECMRESDSLIASILVERGLRLDLPVERFIPDGLLIRVRTCPDSRPCNRLRR